MLNLLHVESLLLVELTLASLLDTGSILLAFHGLIHPLSHILDVSLGFLLRCEHLTLKLLFNPLLFFLCLG